MNYKQDLDETLALVAQAVADFAKPDAARARAARDAADGCDAAAWEGMAEQGWLAVLLPESLGGTALGMRAAALIAERLGYAGHSEPFVATAVMAATALLRCPAGPCRDTLLEGLVRGLCIALAWQPPLGALSPAATVVTAREERSGLALSGVARFVVPAQAGQYLVAARMDGQMLLCAVDADASGLSMVKERTADGGLSLRLDFDRVVVERSAILAQGDAAESAVQSAIESGVLCTAAELLGAITRMLEVTQTYLCERQQFGQHIGAFQVLQHRLVDMWMQKELTRAAVGAAVTAFDAAADAPGPLPDACVAAASSAKARASEAALFVTGQAVQLHGAIGTTDEYELGVYVNRSLTLAAALGNAAFHRSRFGALVAVEER